MNEIVKYYKTLLPCEKFIVTGSLALSYMGLYDKTKVGDIDIIIYNPDKSCAELLQRLMKDNPAKFIPSDGNAYFFMHKETKMNVWLTTSQTEGLTNIMTDGFYLSTCDTIIKAKKDYNRPKDWFQLRKIARLFFKQEEFEAFLNSK